MSLLLKLPTVLSTEILTVWVTFKAVVKCDTAFCSHDQRLQLLDMFASSSFIFSSQVNVNGFHWIAKHNIKLKRVDISFHDSEKVEELASHFLDLIKSCISSITFSGENENSLSVAITGLVNHCRNLEHLEILTTSTSTLIFTIII